MRRAPQVPNFRTLKQVAAFINANPDLKIRAQVDRGYASTDRKIRGTRLRHPGKGRTGLRIRIYDATFDTFPRLLLDHNNAETYRCTSEVTAWLRDYIHGLP